MNDEKQKSQRGPLLAMAAAIVIGLIVWRFAMRSERVPERAAEPAPTTEEAVANAPSPPFAPRPVPKPAPVPSTAYDYDHEEGELPLHPAGTATGSGMMRPHPITPQHERIFHENHLIGQLNGAMDVKDVKGMRQLLAQYRDEYPEDEHVMQMGYQLIADCMESPGEATRSVAKKYYDTELASGLRRYIRRFCLEN